MPTTFRNARLVDPSSHTDVVTNVTIRGDRVAAVGDQVDGEAIDATGLVLAPGLVDLHVHFREPGFEDSETIRSGTRAAAAGGFTAVFPMANTEPVTDTVERVQVTLSQAANAPWCDVHPIAALSYGLTGAVPTDVAALAAAGVRLFSDDGIPVASAALLREQLYAAAANEVVVSNHAQDPALTVGAQANEGPPAADVHLCGWPGVGETIMVARDILLAEDTGATLHVPHISTAATVQVIREAKLRGARITAEAAPHHFTLTDELVRRRDPLYKVNPPIRSAEDVAAIRDGLADGTIDAIATDHAPHAAHRKSGTFEEAAFGMIGLETSLALVLTQLVAPGHVSMLRAMEMMSTAPARIGGLEHQGGPVASGRRANLVLFDPEARWVVDPASFQSLSRNCPFEGYEVQGRVVHTILNGRFTVRDGHIVD